jgi:uncharacterized membrane protein (UPF0127 family)
MKINLLIDDKNSNLNILYADTFCKRLLGFMFGFNRKYDGIFFPNTNSIQTFNMKFNLDLLFFNHSLVCVAKKLNTKKNNVINVSKGLSCLELKTGLINEKDENFTLLIEK